MSKYYTVMVIPDRGKAIKKFKFPRIMYKSFSFLVAMFILVLVIVIYDYTQIVQQVYQNKHLTLENRQLREQIQLFQMKLNSLSNDINRIQIFENKLKVITGLEKIETEQNNLEPDLSLLPDSMKKKLIDFSDGEKIINSENYQQLKKLYEQRLAQNLGVQASYTYTKDWSSLLEKSFKLADDFSNFDYRYDILKSSINDIEVSINELDQYILDNKSILQSTPSLLPAKGWITSYYGPRKSPHSGRLKMHEGLDIGANRRTPIIAPADGVVSFSGRKAGFGKFVQLDHGYGIETIFGHANDLFVKEGEKVIRGQRIASVGNTGLSTGPHLHYEVRVNGIAVNPLFYILD